MSTESHIGLCNIMIPVIAIVGRPNVGKSTLFNCLTGTRQALVADQPGVTRDRQYGQGQFGNHRFIVIDTGGIGHADDVMSDLTAQQTRQAIMESDHILFMVDAQSGCTAADEIIAQQLRTRAKSVTLVVNKVDNPQIELSAPEFYSLGFENLFSISASHTRGIDQLLSKILAQYNESPIEELTEQQSIKVAIVGKPNAGKSTLVNRLLGEERVIVYDLPGTTRDSLYIPFERLGQHYTLIDTAGVRRKRSVEEFVEKISIIKTLQAISDAHVVIMLIDARSNISEQDLHLLGFIIEAGKSLVIAVNKWDNLNVSQKERVRSELDRRLKFIDFAKIIMISALHGTGVGDLYKLIQQAYRSATKKLVTPELTRILERAVITHQPPLVHGRRVKLRYAHAGGHNPPVIVIHGNQANSLPSSYCRFLEGFFRHALRLVGTPIRIEFKEGINPYAGKKNVLTESQKRKRRRVIQHRKKSN